MMDRGTLALAVGAAVLLFGQVWLLDHAPWVAWALGLSVAGLSLGLLAARWVDDRRARRWQDERMHEWQSLCAVLDGQEQ